MTGQRRHEVRIPIPGTPAFIIQTVQGNSEKQEKRNLEANQKDEKAQQELDNELADSFPSSDPLSAVQPKPCPEGTVSVEGSDNCEEIKKAS
jgi:hypothetical protein